MEIIFVSNPDNLSEEQASSLRTRKAARGVVFNQDNKVALLPVTAHNFYKLPGGGMEEGESEVDAFRRECLEEIGFDVEVIQELGAVMEYRTEMNLLQTSYCYIGKVIGDRRQTTLTDHEKEQGFKEPLWVSLDEAIKLMESLANNYEGKFIVERDTFLLNKVKEINLQLS